jgi:hypothetical protein
MDGEVSLGRIFGRAFGVMGHNPLVVFGGALLFAALPQLFTTGVLGTVRPAIGDADYLGVTILIAVVGGIAALIFSALVQGSIVVATLADSEGRQAGFGECIVTGLRRAVPLILVAIISGIGIGIGSVLLIVPGIILAVMWAVAAPAVVAENAGVFESLSRSRALTKGSRWKILGLYLVLVVVALLIAGASSVIFGSAAAARQAAFLSGFSILNAIVNTITTAIWGTIQTSLYVELRDAKEGPQAQQLGTIFA